MSCIDMTPQEVIPPRRETGKGALGKWRALTRITVRTLGRVSGGYLDGCRVGDITCLSGVYAGGCLSLGLHGKVLRGKPLLPIRRRRRDPTVRDERGACGNVGYGGIRNPLHIPKGCRSETLCLKLRAPYFYPTLLSQKKTSS